MIYYFSIKLEILIAEIRPSFTNMQEVRFSRFQVIKLTGFCAQRPLLRIAASREHDMYVWILLLIISVLPVHAAIHCHLIFLRKPAAKLGRKLEPLHLAQLHRNGHIHFAGQGGVFAFFCTLCQQPQILPADGGTTFRYKNFSRHHSLLASKVEHTAIGSRQTRSGPVGSGGYRTSAVSATDGLHMEMINRHSLSPAALVHFAFWGRGAQPSRAQTAKRVCISAPLRDIHQRRKLVGIKKHCATSV